MNKVLKVVVFTIIVIGISCNLSKENEDLTITQNNSDIINSGEKSESEDIPKFTHKRESIFEGNRYYIKDTGETVSTSYDNLSTSTLLDKYNLGLGMITLERIDNFSGYDYGSQIIDLHSSETEGLVKKYPINTELECVIIDNKEEFDRQTLRLYKNESNGRVIDNNPLENNFSYSPRSIYMRVSLTMTNLSVELTDFKLHDNAKTYLENNTQTQFMEYYGDCFINKIDLGLRYEYFVAIRPYDDSFQSDKSIMKSILKAQFAQNYLGVEKDLSYYNQGITEEDLNNYSTFYESYSLYGAGILPFTMLFHGYDNFIKIKEFMRSQLSGDDLGVVKLYFQEIPLFKDLKDNFFNNVRTLNYYYNFIYDAKNVAYYDRYHGSISPSIILENYWNDASNISSLIDSYMANDDSFDSYELSFMDKYFNYLK